MFGSITIHIFTCLHLLFLSTPPTPTPFFMNPYTENNLILLGAWLNWSPTLISFWVHPSSYKAQSYVILLSWCKLLKEKYEKNEIITKKAISMSQCTLICPLSNPSSLMTRRKLPFNSDCLHRNKDNKISSILVNNSKKVGLFWNWIQ